MWENRTSNDEIEALVPRLWELLNLLRVELDVDALAALLDEVGGDLRLGLTDVLLAEEELAVEVGHVDRVEINDLDVAKAGEGEVLIFV